GGKLTDASASLETVYGKIGSDWQLKNGKLELEVLIPVNTTATVVLPGAQDREISEGGKPLTATLSKATSAVPDGAVAIRLGSGRYRFAYAYNAPPESGR